MEQNSAYNVNPKQLGPKDNLHCRLVFLPVNQLRPHPSYVKHRLSVSATQLTALSDLGDLVWEQPIVVTQTGIVVDGYARWELARRQGRQSILCIEYELSEEEALRRLILSHHPLRGLNGYCRSILALDLQPSLQERARLNQQIGGQKKGSSDLTEAQRLDVRSELARAANVSTGNLTKAKQVQACCDPVVQDATKVGEISVHKASQWKCLPYQHQLKKLEEFRSRKGVLLVSRRLIQKHVERMTPMRLFPSTLSDVLKPMTDDQVAVLDTIVVSEIDIPGRIAYFTKDAISALSYGRNLNATSQLAEADSRSNKTYLG